MTYVILPLRAGIGGRLVGFVAMTTEDDSKAFQGLQAVAAQVVLRGRSESKSAFLDRAKRTFSVDVLPVTE